MSTTTQVPEPRTATCPRCHGTGKAHEVSLVFDATFYFPCRACMGTGKARCVCPEGGAGHDSRHVPEGWHVMTCPFDGPWEDL